MHEILLELLKLVELKELEAERKVDELEKALEGLELTGRDVGLYETLKSLLNDLDEINELQDRVLKELESI